MPIYEYECEQGHRFEELRPIDEFVEAVPCSRCWYEAKLVPSLCAMQPDTMWSGIKNEQGYFTSKKQYLNNLRDKNLTRVERGMIEEVSKKGKNRLKETTEKNAIKTERWLAKELASA